MGLEPLRAMLAPVASARPPAAAFAGCQYFQADVLLRALKARRSPAGRHPHSPACCRPCGLLGGGTIGPLPHQPRPPSCHYLHHTRPGPPPSLQFLDTMIQRDSMQKAAFLRDLPAMCAQFDGRVLRYKVGGWGVTEVAVAAPPATLVTAACPQAALPAQTPAREGATAPPTSLPYLPCGAPAPPLPAPLPPAFARASHWAPPLRMLFPPKQAAGQGLPRARLRPRRCCRRCCRSCGTCSCSPRCCPSCWAL